MTQLVLTPKSIRAYKYSSTFPTGDGNFSAGVADTYVYADTPIVLNPVVVANDYLVFRAKIKSNQTGTLTMRIQKSDGTTLILTTVAVAVTGGGAYSTVTSLPILVTNVADYVNCKVQAKNSTGSASITIESASCVMFCADSINITDDVRSKRTITDLQFFSASVSEGLNGKMSTKEDTTFTSLGITGILNSFIWTANSGNTIYSWGGSQIGVEA